MQYNKNQSIADKLQTISQNIVEAYEDTNISQTIDKIQEEYKEIQILSQQNDTPILETISDWMESNLEINSSNDTKISVLVEQKCYSNWIDELVVLLNGQDTTLRALYSSLTSPGWVNNPSAPLLTGLASWVNKAIADQNHAIISTDIDKNSPLEENDLVENTADITDENQLITDDSIYTEETNNSSSSDNLEKIFILDETENHLDTNVQLENTQDEDFFDDNLSLPGDQESLGNNATDSLKNFDTSKIIEETPVISSEINITDTVFEVSHSDENTNDSLYMNEFQITWDDDIHPELLMAYLEETPAQINNLLPLLDLMSKNQASLDDRIEASRLAQTIKGGSSVVGVTALAEFSSQLEIILNISKENELSPEILSEFPAIGDCLELLFDAIQLQLDEPNEFIPLYKTLKSYILSLDEDLVNHSNLQDNIEEPEIGSAEQLIITDLDSDVLTDLDSLEELNLYDDELIQDTNRNDLDIAKEELNESLTSSYSETIQEQNFIDEEYLEANEIEIPEVTEEEKNQDELITTSEINHRLMEDDNELTENISNEQEQLKFLKLDNDLVEIFDTSRELSQDTSNNDSRLEIIESNKLIEDSNTLNSSSHSDNASEPDSEHTLTDKQSPESIEQNHNMLDQESNDLKFEKSPFQLNWNDDTHPELLMVYLEETPTQLNELIPLMNKISEGDANADDKHVASRMAHTIKGGSALVGITALSEISYRLETLLDHSIKNQLPDDILSLLPSTGSCLENLFDAVQMQDEEPDDFYSIFKKLDYFVENIEESDEPLELSKPVLPDFILNQNNIDVESSLKEANIQNYQELDPAESVDALESAKDTIEDEKKSLTEGETSLEDIIDDKDSAVNTEVTIAKTAEDQAVEYVASTNQDTVPAFESLSETEVPEAEETSTNTLSITPNDAQTTLDRLHSETTDEDSELDHNNELEQSSDAAIQQENQSNIEKSPFQLNWSDDVHPELLMVYLEETPTQLNELIPLMNKISQGSANDDEKHIASRMAHTIKGGSTLVGITALSEISYRLETLLDHSIKNQLPDDILSLLPSTGSCLENLFDAVQMQDEEPDEYYTIFKKLDYFVENIEESDEPIELSAPALPDFILNQNKTNEVIDIDNAILSDEKDDSITSEEEAIPEEIEQIQEASQENLSSDSENNNAEDLQNESNDEELPQENKDQEESTNEITPPTDFHNLNKSDDIGLEFDNIIMNLIGASAESDKLEVNLDNYISELQDFDTVVHSHGYPELTVLSKWCKANLDSFVKTNDESTNNFVNSGEVWLWIEYVGASLNEPDDISHMSLLSAELMRDDWVEAIEMDDLQTVLLALRNIDDSAPISEVEENKETNSDEIISWDKDVHPELLAVYFSETPDQINEVSELLQLISRGESNTKENEKAARIAHTIKGASGVVGLNSLVELTHSLEDILDYSVNHNIPTETSDLLAEASDCMESLFETIQDKQAPPHELDSVLERLSAFSSSIGSLDDSPKELPKDNDPQDNLQSNTLESKNTDNLKPSSEIDTEATIRVPISVIDKLINLAGELVTTSSQVSDNIENTLITNNTIRTQDERIHKMLSELTTTIVKQEKNQQNLLSSIDNSDFDSLEMDTYNELHSVANLLSESIIDGQEIDNTLNKQLHDLSDKIRSLEKLNRDFSDVILSSRMVSINTIVPRLERIVRQTCRKTNKKAKLLVVGNNINIDTDILNGLIDPLLHMLRNSIDHGIETPETRVQKNKDETGLIELSFMRDGNNIIMTLEDDGAGINSEVIFQKAIDKNLINQDQKLSKNETLNLILQPGFTTQENITDISGRGVGMDVVNSSVKELNGVLSIDSDIGKGTIFNLTIPLTLITNTTLLVKASENTIAIPTDTIEQILYQEANSVIQRGEEHFVKYENEEILITSLSKLLYWSNQKVDFRGSYNVLIIKSGDESHAVHIDSILSSREVVVKPLSPWIGTHKGIIGACHLNDGGVAPVINLLSVIQRNKEDQLSGSFVETVSYTEPEITKQILVVDDSLSNRKALSLIIDKTNYNVITAVDGMDALQIMNENDINLVFTDLEMPRMNGLELTQAVRAWEDKSKTPIVMITSRTTSKHRDLAQKAGVDDYLTKPVVTETLLESIDKWLERA